MRRLPSRPSRHSRPTRLLRISAEFVTSAAGPRDFPDDGLAEVAMVGRSNVGKSSLINALTRQRIARTSAEPGKTRLVNVYQVSRGSASPFYLVDLPGYGYARRGRPQAVAQSAAAGPRVVRGRYLHRDDRTDRPDEVAAGQEQPLRDGDFESLLQAYFGRQSSVTSALLLVDSRHPGLENDRAAWQWLQRTGPSAVVATKIDKLTRAQRIRALRELESAFESTVVPVSSVTGEGLDELWKLIDKLANSRHP